MQLIQRNDILTFNELLIKGYEQGKSKKDIEKLLDIIVLKDFLENSFIDNIPNDIKETFFLENNRFKNFFSHIYSSKEELSKKLNLIFEKIDFSKNKDDYILDIINGFDNIRNEINEKSSGRKRFSLTKDSLEILSRSKKIFKTLNKLEIKINDENDYILKMKEISYEIIQDYIKQYPNKKNKDIEIIQSLSSDIQRNIQSFYMLKNNNIKNPLLIYKEKQLKEIPNLVGKNSTAGSDYAFRIKKILVDLLIKEDLHSKSKSYKVLSKKEKKELKKITKEHQFKKDLRKLLLSILKVHNIDTNQNSNTLFLNSSKLEFKKFLLDKDGLESFLNITLQTPDDNNETLHTLLLNLSDLNSDNILGFLNQTPIKNLLKLRNHLKDDLNIKEKDKIENQIKKIENVKELFNNFKEKYGENMLENITDEFIKLYNYNDFVMKHIDNVEKLVEQGIKPKEFFKLDNCPNNYFTIEEVKERIEKDKPKSTIKKNIKLKNNLNDIFKN